MHKFTLSSYRTEIAAWCVEIGHVRYFGKSFLSVSIFYLTISLWARDLYGVIVDEGAARVNYNALKSRANNLIVLV